MKGFALNAAASPATISSLAATDGVRLWDQPLGDILHAKLNRLVGPDALRLEFDTSDADFTMALTSKWPVTRQQDSHLVFDHVGLMKLADVMNTLVRLYALETGHTFVHALVEARRGIAAVPSWWAEAPCLFVTYGFDTQQGQVCFADDPAAAFAAMRWLDNPHRLLLAIGPGTPVHLRRDEKDIWADADAEHLRALQRWEQQLSQQLARLLSFTDGGGMFAEEALVNALSTMRGHAQRVRGSIIDIQRRRQRQQPVTENDVQGLVQAMHDLKGALQGRSVRPDVSLPERAALRRSLSALQKLEGDVLPPVSHFVLQPAKAAPPPAANSPAKVVRAPVRRLARKMAVKGKQPVAALKKAMAPKRPMRIRKRKALVKKVGKKGQGIIGYYEMMNDDDAWAGHPHHRLRKGPSL